LDNNIITVKKLAITPVELKTILISHGWFDLAPFEMATVTGQTLTTSVFHHTALPSSGLKLQDTGTRKRIILQGGRNNWWDCCRVGLDAQFRIEINHCWMCCLGIYIRQLSRIGDEKK
jgi:hypothetical protein